MLLSVIWLLYLLVKLVSRLFLDEVDVSRAFRSWNEYEKKVLTIIILFS